MERQNYNSRYRPGRDEHPHSNFAQKETVIEDDLSIPEIIKKWEPEIEAGKTAIDGISEVQAMALFLKDSTVKHGIARRLMRGYPPRPAQDDAVAELGSKLYATIGSWADIKYRAMIKSLSWIDEGKEGLWASIHPARMGGERYGDVLQIVLIADFSADGTYAVETALLNLTPYMATPRIREMVAGQRKRLA